MHLSHYAAPRRLTDILRRYRYWWLSFATAIALLLSPLVNGAVAQSAYPAFQHPYVNDYGEVLAAEDEANVSNRLEQFRTQTGKHAVLLTIDSITDYSTGDSTIESFATNLFNTWGIGDATRNDGILILVAPGDRKVRIELGKGYPGSDDRVAQAIIDERMLPHFREGQMSRGTIAGVDGVIARFDPSQPSTMLPAIGRSQDLGLLEKVIQGILIAIALIFQFGFIFILVAIGVGWLVFRRWQRFRKRQCPHCQTEMERLDETADDQYLESGQRREEVLTSVDYDVWLCRSCGYHTTKSFTNYFSGYKSCPECRHKTLSVKSTTTVHPTHHRSGKARVDEKCKFCTFTRTYTKTLPRLQSSSGSSSSSHGGGGRSSGGGASGSW